ncbi:hypothetical protein V1511DRAFT_448655, partial [Dipodascopsis uninucleata]
TLHKSKPYGLTSVVERREVFVESLVDTAAILIESLWPSATCEDRSVAEAQILPLRTFIEETLRRSRTSYSTLQVALYYLVLIRPLVKNLSGLSEELVALQCGRRSFLTSLMLASKYLQDKNYSAKAWSKISGLSTSEINANEIAFLKAVNWKIHISEDAFERWSAAL